MKKIVFAERTDTNTEHDDAFDANVVLACEPLAKAIDTLIANMGGISSGKEKA